MDCWPGWSKTFLKDPPDSKLQMEHFIPFYQWRVFRTSHDITPDNIIFPFKTFLVNEK